MEQIETNEQYSQYVDKKSPNSPIFKNCFNAFWVGGLICSIGQFISDICKFRGLNTETSGSIVAIILIGISAFLTSLNLFNRIRKICRCGFSYTYHRFCKLYCLSCY